MIDGEGHVSHQIKSHSRRIVIANTDLDLLAACEEAAETLGFTCRTYRRSRKQIPRRQPVFVTEFGGESTLRMIAAIVPLHSPKKKQILNEAIGSYRPRFRERVTASKDYRGRWEGVYRRNPGAKVLRELYQGRGYSIPEIARFLDLSPMTVRRWMAKAEIKSRTLSEAVTKRWERGYSERIRNGPEAEERANPPGRGVVAPRGPQTGQ